MRLVVGIALLGLTGIATAAAQTNSSEPSVTVDYNAIPNDTPARTYSGERVVVPLIYPDGSMAVPPTAATPPAPTDSVTLIPPSQTETPATAEAPAAAQETTTAAVPPAAEESPASPTQASPAGPDFTPPTQSTTTSAPVTETPTTAETETPASGAVPTPARKPDTLASGAPPADQIPTVTAPTQPPASQAPSEVSLFTQPSAATVKAQGKPEPQPETQIAAISPEAASAPTKLAPGAAPQVLFLAGGTQLDGSGMATLDALAQQLTGTKERIELHAFAGKTADPASTPKKLALRRALAVRTYLINKGIDAGRITVKARGDATDGAPERVDIVRASG